MNCFASFEIRARSRIKALTRTLQTIDNPPRTAIITSSKNKVMTIDEDATSATADTSAPSTNENSHRKKVFMYRRTTIHYIPLYLLSSSHLDMLYVGGIE